MLHKPSAVGIGKDFSMISAAPMKGDKGSTSPAEPEFSGVNAKSFSIVKQASKLSMSPSAN